ncbi:MAG: carboxypeptidase regulatory-like domain-containing protein [Gemmatimonadota bacterium]
MSQHTSRLVASLCLLGLVFNLTGVPLASAADGSVFGRVRAESGQLPPGSLVRATPRDGGPAITVPIRADGTYEIPGLPEGAYRLEVLGPKSDALAPGLPVLVETFGTPIDLSVAMAAVPPPGTGEQPSANPRAEKEQGAEAEEPGEEGEADDGNPGISSKTKKAWLIVIASVVGLGIGIAAADDDEEGSPSLP